MRIQNKIDFAKKKKLKKKKLKNFLSPTFFKKKFLSPTFFKKNLKSQNFQFFLTENEIK